VIFSPTLYTLPRTTGKQHATNQLEFYQHLLQLILVGHGAVLNCYTKAAALSKGILQLPSAEAECTEETQLLKKLVKDNIWKQAGEKVGNLVNYKVVNM
jgi:hypothetical protein